jgi:hypothetical protein
MDLQKLMDQAWDMACEQWIENLSREDFDRLCQSHIKFFKKLGGDMDLYRDQVNGQNLENQADKLDQLCKAAE